MMKLLFVDEEPEILSIAELHLKKFGNYEIITALSVKDALVLLKDYRFDAIISDYEMPETDGLTFLKKIRESMPAVPFIFFSGKGREEVIIEAFRSGADGYVQKGKNPFAIFAELSHQIQNAVSRRKVEDELRIKEYAIENSINGVAIADYDTSEIIYVNKAALEIFGYLREEISLMKTTDFLSEADYPSLKKNLTESLEEKNYFIGELKVKKKDGSDLFISISITSLLPDQNSAKMLFISFVDVTEKIEASEESLQFILEASRRIREPVSLIGQSLEDLSAEIDSSGIDPEILNMKIRVLMNNARQVVRNMNDLNMAVANANERINEDYKKYLIK